jgi:septum formation protein
VWADGETTLGADTTVVVDSQILGKPSSETEAVEMLSLLAGRNHQVITGYCLFDGAAAQAGAETTTVFFAPMSPDEIMRYVRSGEPFDKAGGYGIQGLASKFIQRVEGCYFNVVGLPIARIYGLLKL